MKSIIGRLIDDLFNGITWEMASRNGPAGGKTYLHIVHKLSLDFWLKQSPTSKPLTDCAIKMCHLTHLSVKNNFDKKNLMPFPSVLFEMRKYNNDRYQFDVTLSRVVSCSQILFDELTLCK